MSEQPPKPRTYTSDLRNLPPALAPLTQQPRWVLWRWEPREAKDGVPKWTKPPLQVNGAYAKNNDPKTWATYNEVLAAIDSVGADGIGYMLLDDELHLAANDFDDCRDEQTGKIEPWAQTYLDQANGAYVEISPSGTGLRIIGISSKPPVHNKYPIKNGRERAAIEVYRNIKTGRYITVTGLELDPGHCGALTNIDSLIDRIIAQHRDAGRGSSDSNEHYAGDDRSATFHSRVWQLAASGCSVAEIEQHLRRDTSGVAAKYLSPTDRLLAEIERSFQKWRRQNCKQAASAVAVDSKWASEFEMEAVDWLWPWRIARSALNLLVGLPDKGKGCLWSDIAARITTGEDWPANEGRAPQGNVIIFSAEDHIKNTVVPRLKAAGADLGRVKIVGMAHIPDGAKRMFNLVTDLWALKAKIEEVGNVALIIIDPVAAYLGIGKISGGSQTDVRGVLAPLVDLAEQMGVAILAVMHFNKKVDVNNALLRIADSVAYGATARTVYAALDDPDNEDAYLYVKAKNNLGPKNASGLRYMIGVREVGFDKRLDKKIEAPYVLWDNNPVKMTANEAMEAAGGGSRGRAKDDAKDFLRSRLAMGPVKASDIQAEARARCIAEATLRRAKRDLRIASEKRHGEIDGDWYWSLPPAQARGNL
jgi:hypothetical protein